MSHLHPRHTSHAQAKRAGKLGAAANRTRIKGGAHSSTSSMKPGTTSVCGKCGYSCDIMEMEAHQRKCFHHSRQIFEQFYFRQTPDPSLFRLLKSRHRWQRIAESLD